MFIGSEVQVIVHCGLGTHLTGLMGKTTDTEAEKLGSSGLGGPCKLLEMHEQQPGNNRHLLYMAATRRRPVG